MCAKYSVFFDCHVFDCLVVKHLLSFSSYRTFAELCPYVCFEMAKVSTAGMVAEFRGKLFFTWSYLITWNTIGHIFFLDSCTNSRRIFGSEHQNGMQEPWRFYTPVNFSSGMSRFLLPNSGCWLICSCYHQQTLTHVINAKLDRILCISGD